MQKHQAAPVVVRFRPTRAALLAALAGLVALAFGLFAPLSAQAGDHSGNGRGGDKPWICHPVEGKGENGAGWNVINPNAHSSHINEQNGAGKHTRKDGRTDTYASGKDCGQGYPSPTKTHHPTPTYTKTHHHPKPHPTTTCPTTSTTTTSTTTTTTTTSSTTTSSTPSTGATSSSTTSKPVTPATSPSSPESPATNPPTVAPAPSPPAEAATQPPAAAPVAAPVAQAQAPQQAAVVQNAVPQAATDGADLQPQAAGLTGLQPALIGAGALLLLAAGLLSARRTPTD